MVRMSLGHKLSRSQIFLHFPIYPFHHLHPAVQLKKYLESNPKHAYSKESVSIVFYVTHSQRQCSILSATLLFKFIYSNLLFKFFQV